MTIKKPQSLEEFKRHRKPPRNINKAFADSLSKTDRFAVFITDHIGTFGFFCMIFTWTVCWLSWNLLAPPKLQFDPPMGFVLWLFISNVIQILLMPLLMVGQNLQGARSEIRAENDLEINVKAEQEIEVILNHLEYQNSILIAMMQKMGVSLEELKAGKE
ncbi:MAG TPA: DUF1003 domain-containing protein [Rickettsiales bacterium]|nr:DUF1003 domain-containing protein [Rickettsiales bacterium]